MATIEDANTFGLPKRKFYGVRGDVTVLHWNILAQSLCFDDGKPAFTGVKNAETVLSWAYRKPRIVAVMLEHAPDFICAVEVDKFDELLAELKPHGYKGVIGRKCANDHADGCAIFYKSDNWLLESSHKCRLTEKHSQIAMYCDFRCVRPVILESGQQQTRKLTIVSTHLKAKPGFEALRARQLERVLVPCSIGYDTQLHETNVIVAGDINDIQDSQAMNDNVYAQSKPFCDAYRMYEREREAGGEDMFTTYKKRERVVKRVIDYILFKPSVMVCSGVLCQPDLADVPDMLPASYYPSDHIALLASFRFTE